MCFRRDSVRFCGEVLEASEMKTVLGIQIENKLNFEKHIKSHCSKTSQKPGYYKDSQIC